MVEDRQLVLFFNNGFDVDNLASILVKKFEFLGEVLVIPKNEEKTPFIVFQQGEVKLTIYEDSVNINYLINFDFSKIIEIIEVLENEGFDFIRMGYISIYFVNELGKNKYVENTFVNDSKRNNHFQLYRYNQELIDSVKVNVVEIERTNDEDNIAMTSIFDINTPIDEKYNITSSFLENFIKECDKYTKVIVENNSK